MRASFKTDINAQHFGRKLSVADQACFKDSRVQGSGHDSEVEFRSARQNTLLQILHVLRRLDAALAQSLLDSYDQLAIAARRYPNGVETM